MAFDLADALRGFGGGLLIGLASAVFLLGLGRIAGVSGLVGALLRPGAADKEAAAFVAGLLLLPLCVALLFGAPEIVLDRPAWAIAVAGLLVGAGVRLGGGCTSGHGVCGLSRAAPRSIGAVAVFMGVGVAVATLTGWWF
ncbi:MAG: YeeE/YedE family protein [Pikeienuella sp.]